PNANSSTPTSTHCRRCSAPFRHRAPRRALRWLASLTDGSFSCPGAPPGGSAPTSMTRSASISTCEPPSSSSRACEKMMRGGTPSPSSGISTRRGVRRAPLFALVVLMTIALGIGANTAVFSVVRSVLLARLPYREPDRLVRLYGTAPGKPNAQGMLTPVEISAVQQSRALSGVGVWGWFGGVTYVGDRSTEQWESVQVTPDFFHVLGVRPWLGRTIDARDVGPDAAPVAVLTYPI